MSKPAQLIHRPCFQTPDGSIFLTEAEALQHQAILDGTAWYECNKLYGNHAGSYVEFRDLVEWLQNNWAMVQALANISTLRLDRLEEDYSGYCADVANRLCEDDPTVHARFKAAIASARHTLIHPQS